MTEEPVFESPVMQQLLRMVERVAKSNAAVLLLGETGSGKEVVAQRIHQRSLRAAKPLIDLNCAAIPDHLLESELFGYEKGAFSGADETKPGMFELAHGGTLFLDEIGDLQPALQSKLLRVLDGTPYYRLGGSRKIEVDVRFVSATNRDLSIAVEEGRFRRDLYHRLAQFQISIPPLRERPEDIVALAQVFLRQQNPRARFSPASLRLLTAYQWPGNVRELKNIILRSSMMAESDYIDVDALELTPSDSLHTAASTGEAPAIAQQLVPGATFKDIERSAIFAALLECDGHQGRAAEKLDISRRTLVRKLREYRRGHARPIAYMSDEQQKYFRAEADTVVEIVYEGVPHVGRLRNVSSTGLSVWDLANVLPQQARVVATLHIPAMPDIQVNARVVWTRASGEAGLTFEQTVPRALTSWLLQQQAMEGWVNQQTNPRAEKVLQS